MTSNIWNDWDELFGGFDSIGKRFEELFSDFNTANDNVRTYGYTMFCGPDGIPHTREFGNAIGEHAMNNNMLREPLTDVVLDGNLVRITVELPGVSKEDIQLEGSKDSVTISVNTDTKSFRKDLALPCEVDPDSAKAEYNNGILEILIDSKESKPKGKRIAIQ